MTRSYANDQYGHGGIVAGLRDAAAKPGSVARFEVVDHPQHGRKKYGELAAGFEECGPDGGCSWRIAGEDGTLEGFGSHALIPSWDADQSLAAASTKLAMRLMRLAGGAENAVIFRMNAPTVEVEPVIAHALDHLFGDVMAQLDTLRIR